MCEISKAVKWRVEKYIGKRSDRIVGGEVWRRQTSSWKDLSSVKTETYPTAQPDNNGLRLLGSPRTASVRNPMAMRALFRLRALTNELLKREKLIQKRLSILSLQGD